LPPDLSDTLQAVPSAQKESLESCKATQDAEGAGFQEFMRSDEFWFAEKNPEGATTLTPLSDFKDVRYDLDLRKGYLMGRFGAIPFTGDLRQLKWDAHAEAERQ